MHVGTGGALHGLPPLFRAKQCCIDRRNSRSTSHAEKKQSAPPCTPHGLGLGLGTGRILNMGETLSVRSVHGFPRAFRFLPPVKLTFHSNHNDRQGRIEIINVAPRFEEGLLK